MSVPIARRVVAVHRLGDGCLGRHLFCRQQEQCLARQLAFLAAEPVRAEGESDFPVS